MALQQVATLRGGAARTPLPIARGLASLAARPPPPQAPLRLAQAAPLRRSFAASAVPASNLRDVLKEELDYEKENPAENEVRCPCVAQHRGVLAFARVPEASRSAKGKGTAVGVGHAKPRSCDASIYLHRIPFMAPASGFHVLLANQILSCEHLHTASTSHQGLARCISGSSN